MNNHLTATSAAGDFVPGRYSASYKHDAHGNMIEMPHLFPMTWDERDRLQSTTTTVVRNGGRGAITFYAYDHAGGRVRKTNERPLTPDQVTGTIPARRLNERVYVGPAEVYRALDASGGAPTMIRETLSLMDGDQRLALVEMGPCTASGYRTVVRYQYTNHLNSATLELGGDAQLLSYEEYFAYGTTSYEAVDTRSQTPKRYRYTGKERDDESGLYYYGARYYAAWLGQWTSIDPVLISPERTDSAKAYSYVDNRPTVLIDPDGRDIVIAGSSRLTAQAIVSAIGHQEQIPVALRNAIRANGTHITFAPISQVHIYEPGGPAGEHPASADVQHWYDIYHYLEAAGSHSDWELTTGTIQYRLPSPTSASPSSGSVGAGPHQADSGAPSPSSGPSAVANTLTNLTPDVSRDRVGRIGASGTFVPTPSFGIEVDPEGRPAGGMTFLSEAQVAGLRPGEPASMHVSRGALGLVVVAIDLQDLSSHAVTRLSEKEIVHLLFHELALHVGRYEEQMPYEEADIIDARNILDELVNSSNRSETTAERPQHGRHPQSTQPRRSTQ